MRKWRETMCRKNFPKNRIIIFLLLAVFILTMPSANPVQANLLFEIDNPPEINEWGTESYKRVDQTNSIGGADQRDSTKWEIDCALCKPYFYHMDTHNIQLDSNDNPHIIFGGDHLYYVYYGDSEWHRILLDGNPHVGGGSSLFLDENDHPHISYFDEFNNFLKYAYFDGSEWHFSEVKQNLMIPKTTSLAVDSSGNPHICFVDNETMTYAANDGSDWAFYDYKNSGEFECSMAVDNNDNPHLLFVYNVEESGTYLRHSFFDDSNMLTEDIAFDSDDWGISNSSVAIDSQNNIHIIYNQIHQDYLKYGYRDASGWTLETIHISDSYSATSISIDQFDNPHISFYNIYEGVQYARYNPDTSDWEFYKVGDNYGGYNYTSLDLNASNLPVILFFDEKDDALKFTFVSDSNWVTWIIEYRKRGGDYTSISIDQNDQPHIGFRFGPSYYGNDFLFYAYKVSDSWQIHNSNKICDGWISTDFDSNDIAHIIYTYLKDLEGWMGDVPSLRYATFNGNNWTDEELFWIGSAFTEIRYNALAIDSNDKLHIGYQHTGENNLEYRSGSGSDWSLIHIIDENEAGFYTSLDIDSENNPHIVYVSNTVLKYTYYDGDQWKIHAFNDSVAYTSIALDSQDLPHISYTLEDTHNLIYTYFDGIIWKTYTVDSQSEVYDTVIALDKENNPHIAYYADNSLKYAYFDGQSWLIETIDPNGDVGKYPSIAIDSLDQPQISYYDASNWDLKYAFLPWETSNAAPAFISIPKIGAAQDVAYEYNVQTDDPDLNHGDTMTISANAIPAWLTLTDKGDGTALLSGTPGGSQLGEHTVTLVVTDSLGLSDTQSFTITVSEEDPSPNFTSSPITHATEGVKYQYGIRADDPDLSRAEALTITAPVCPVWLLLTDNGDGTGVLQGTPNAVDIGEHAVQLVVTDSQGFTDSQSFTITVVSESESNNTYIPVIIH